MREALLGLLLAFVAVHADHGNHHGAASFNARPGNSFSWEAIRNQPQGRPNAWIPRSQPPPQRPLVRQAALQQSLRQPIPGAGRLPPPPFPPSEAPLRPIFAPAPVHSDQRQRFSVSAIRAGSPPSAVPPGLGGPPSSRPPAGFRAIGVAQPSAVPPPPPPPASAGAGAYGAAISPAEPPPPPAYPEPAPPPSYDQAAVAPAPAPAPSYEQEAVAPAPAPSYEQAAIAPAPAPSYDQAAVAPAPAPSYDQAAIAPAPAPAPSYDQAAVAPAPAPSYEQEAVAPAPAPSYDQQAAKPAAPPPSSGYDQQAALPAAPPPSSGYGDGGAPAPSFPPPPAGNPPSSRPPSDSVLLTPGSSGPGAPPASRPPPFFAPAPSPSWNSARPAAGSPPASRPPPSFAAAVPAPSWSGPSGGSPPSSRPPSTQPIASSWPAPAPAGDGYSNTAPAAPPPASGYDQQAALPAVPPPPSGYDQQAALPAAPPPSSGYDQQAALPATPPPPSGYDQQAALPAVPPPSSGYDQQAALPAAPPPSSGYDQQAALPAAPPIPSAGYDQQAALPAAPPPAPAADYGATAANPAPAPGYGATAANPAPAPAPAPGYGATAANPAPAPAPGYGATAANPAPAPAPGYGASAANPAPAPAPGYGATAANPAPAPAPGYGATAANPAPAPGGYGATAANPAPAPAPGYGATAANPAPAPGGYGASAANPAPAPGGYGATAANPAPAPGGYGSIGANPAPSHSFDPPSSQFSGSAGGGYGNQAHSAPAAVPPPSWRPPVGGLPSPGQQITITIIPNPKPGTPGASPAATTAAKPATTSTATLIPGSTPGSSIIQLTVPQVIAALAKQSGSGPLAPPGDSPISQSKQSGGLPSPPGILPPKEASAKLAKRQPEGPPILPSKAAGNALSEGQCSYNKDCWLASPQVAIANGVMYKRETGVDCDECLNLCAREQGGESPYVCQSMTYDHRFKICDLYAVRGDQAPRYLTSYPGRDYFRPDLDSCDFVANLGKVASRRNDIQKNNNNADKILSLSKKSSKTEKAQPEPQPEPEKTADERCGKDEMSIYGRFRNFTGPKLGENVILEARSIKDCRKACEKNLEMDSGEVCNSFTFGEGSCILSGQKVMDEYNKLLAIDSENYYERYCLPKKLAKRADRMWEMVPGRILVGHVQAVETVASLKECQSACLSATFVCMSGMFYPEDDVENCLLNSESAQTKKELFVEESLAGDMVYFEPQLTGKRRAIARSRAAFGRVLRDEGLGGRAYTAWSRCHRGLQIRFRRCRSANVRACRRQTRVCLPYAEEVNSPL